MYHFIFIFGSVLSGVFCGLSTISTKSDLLAVIRQDLRRNNDDYIESTVSEPTLPSSKPPPSAVQVPPVSTPNKVVTTNKIVTTTILKTTMKPLMNFRRSFQSSEILPIDDKPKKFKHSPIILDPSQYVKTMTKIPGTELKRPRPPRTRKSSEMAGKNDLDRPGKKELKQKFSIKIEGKAKASDSGEELKKIEDFMKDLEKKEQLMNGTSTQATTRKKIQGMSKAEPQRMGLVMSKMNEPPMVVPLRDKPPVALDVVSIEEPTAPWEMPRLETTRGEAIRMGLKSYSNEMPLWRAVGSKEEKKRNKPQHPVKRARNEMSKTKNSEKNTRTEKMEKKLRHMKPDDTNQIIKDLKMKLREGMKLSSLPPGELLDMWPARGPRVHAMRIRNRLCQRSVLLNEGPKYDSKGGTYMPRFKPRILGTKKVIDFHQTKVPKFLLPRCCNCCRKSVLGCE